MFCCSHFVLPTSLAAAPKFEDSDVLEHFDFFESFGNEGIEIDEENLTMMFLHQDPVLGVSSYKSFRLEVEEPEVEEQVVHEQVSFKHDMVEFHLIPEKQNDLTKRFQNFVIYDSSLQPIDKKKAYHNFRKIAVPDKYRHDVKGGRHITIGNVRFTQLSKVASKADKDMIALIEYFSITQNPDGSVVIGIESFVPEVPIDSDWLFDWEKIFSIPDEYKDEDDSTGEDSQEPQANVHSSTPHQTQISAKL